MKIGIVVGSIREGRKGKAIGEWVASQAKGREVRYEVIDLKAFDVPLLTAPTHPMMAKKTYADERVQAWSRAIDSCDAYIFVTPEYNHGVPGALKNAVDSLGQEWVGKTVSLVGYGSVGGVRAIENWRTVLANFSMQVTRAEVNLSIFTDWSNNEFRPAERRVQDLHALFDSLEEAVGVSQEASEGDAA